jgi:hypothetical protein
MRVDGGQDKRSDAIEIEPHRQLTPDYPAAFGRSEPGDHIDAANAIATGRLDKGDKPLECVLDPCSVQVEGPADPETAAAQPAPRRVVGSGRLMPNGQFPMDSPRASDGASGIVRRANRCGCRRRFREEWRRLAR